MCRQQRLQRGRVTHVSEQSRVCRPPRGRRHRAANAAPAPGWPAALHLGAGTHSPGQQSTLHSASATRRSLPVCQRGILAALRAHPWPLRLGGPSAGLCAGRHAPGGATRRYVMSFVLRPKAPHQTHNLPPRRLGCQQRPGRHQARLTCASSSSGDVAGLEAAKTALAQVRRAR
jgi:hypothetical protein